MTKEEKRAYHSAYMKIWRANNPEKQKERSKRNYKKNKEKLNARSKEWRANNKEHIKEYNKERRAKQKDGYHRVYLLEDYNYVGVTSNIYTRFRQHKSEFKRDCTNHRVLYKTKDRSEALELEALLHDMGYEGKHQFNVYK